MSSRKAIHNKSLLQSNVLLRILVKDFYLKILVLGNFISCEATSHKRFPPKISCRQATPNHPYKFCLNSDDPCPHATIKVKKTKFIAIPCIISFFCFNFVLLETITNNINNINELWKTTLS